VRHAIAATAALSLRRRVGGARFVGALAIALLPTLNLVLDVAFNGPRERQFDLYLKFIVPLCFYFVTPFVTMMTMLPVLGELYDKGSVAYLYTRPVPRWAPLFGLYLGGVAATLAAFFAAAFVPAAFGALATDAATPARWLSTAFGLFGTLTLGALAYGAVCLFLGVWSRRAILCGLARTWCGAPDDTFSGIFPPVIDPPSATAGVLVLLGAAAAFLWLTARVAERRDVN
jgi:ABC-2 type transport system permease protein